MSRLGLENSCDSEQLQVLLKQLSICLDKDENHWYNIYGLLL